VPTVPSSAGQVTLTGSLHRDAEALQASLRRSRRHATRPVDPTALNLIKRVDSGRVQLTTHMIAYLRAAFEGGATLADLEAPAHQMLATVRSWHVERRSQPTDLRALVMAETEAESQANPVTLRAVLSGDSRSLADAEVSLVQHHSTLGRLIDGVRHKLYARHSSETAVVR
jgi:hypothetical protein